MQRKKKTPKKEPAKGKNIVLELKDKNKDKDKKTKNFTVLYFIAMLIIMVLLPYGYRIINNEVKPLPYSEFKTLLSQGKVSDLNIDKETIQGKMTLEKDKSIAFTTTRVEDTDLTKELEKQGIKFTGRSENKVFSVIVSFVLPLVIMIIIWNLLMRRMGGAPSSVLNFGKSRGKIYGEDEIKITFQDVAGVDEAKEELKEIIEYLQYPKSLPTSAARYRKASSLWARRAQARPSLQKPLPARLKYHSSV